MIVGPTSPGDGPSSNQPAVRGCDGSRIVFLSALRPRCSRPPSTPIAGMVSRTGGDRASSWRLGGWPDGTVGVEVDGVVAGDDGALCCCGREAVTMPRATAAKLAMMTATTAAGATLPRRPPRLRDLVTTGPQFRTLLPGVRSGSTSLLPAPIWEARPEGLRGAVLM